MEEFSGDVGVLLALDWFLDRCRTAVNVEGDLMAGARRVFVVHSIQHRTRIFLRNSRRRPTAVVKKTRVRFFAGW